jgi:hypothetical protein
MTNEQKKWIDEASYQQLLFRWRNAALGELIFQGEAGEYYSKVMAEKKARANHIQASKNIGWEW